MSALVDEARCTFYRVAAVDEIPNGERLYLEIGQEPIVLFNIAGKFYAIRDECTHDGNPLGDGELDGHQIVCPRHGARFDVRDGKALRMPAVADTPAYPVRVVDGQVEIGLP